jgi:hypothetical protein
MRSFRAAVLTALAAALSLCAARLGALDVRLAVPAPLGEAWERTLAAHALPGGVRLVDGGGEGPGISLRAFWGEPPFMPGRWTVVQTRLLAPAAPLGARASGEEPVQPLESITLPFVALPVEGLFPGDPGYPLVQRVALILQGVDPGLDAWFDGVAEAAGSTASDGVDWIGAVGDIMPARGVDSLLARPDGLERVFGDTLPVLQGCDLLIGNLEAAATRRGSKVAKSFTFRFDPAALSLLAEAGFTWLSLTNNHSFDFGPEGFLDTLAALAAAGIGTSGAGLSEEQAQEALEAAAGTTRVRILSFGAYPVDRMGFDGRRTARAAGAKPGILWLDEAAVAAAGRQFGPDTFDIAVVHGGEEWTRGPTAQLRRLCEELLGAGADLVIGSHPHVLHPLEVVDGRLVAWSLGNFLFPGMDGTPGGEDSAILRLGVYGGAVRYVQFIPVRLKGTTVRLAVPE